MALDLTNATRRALSEVNIKPVIALKIDGLDYIFSTTTVYDYIRIGDAGLFINNYNGDPWYIGGLKPIENNLELLDTDKTTFSIRQQMNQQEGKSSSVSSMTLGFIDKNEFMSSVISPGFELTDLLGTKADVYIGFGETSFQDDYQLIFRGFVASITSGPGSVQITLNHPDTKKLSNFFIKTETALDGAIDASQLTFNVENGSQVYAPIADFGSDVDVIYKSYLQIDNELIEVASVSSNTVTAALRGAEGTSATSHNNTSSVTSVHKLQGNPLDIAMSIMSSGFDGASIEDLEITKFVNVGNGTELVDNAIYFDNINIPRDIGAVIGDFVTVSGATNGANNFINRKILDVVKYDTGYYLIVDGAALVLEGSTSAVMSFRSKYDILPDGLSMGVGEIDIAQHEYFKTLFFSATEMRFFIEDTLEGRKFIDEQLYKPIACYALPRKGKSSIGYTVGPIPGAELKTLNADSIKSADSLTISRSIDDSYFNEVVYKYDKIYAEDKFLAGRVTVNEDSKNRIIKKATQYVIEAEGVRRDLDGLGLSQSESNRIIDRYKFAAETIEAKALFKNTVEIEIGDVVLINGRDLKITDIKKGDRDFDDRLFEVLNKTINFKSGDVQLSLLDTGISVNTRFCLMSPGALIDKIFDQKTFTVKNQFNAGAVPYGADEWRYWENTLDLVNPASIRIRNEDFSIVENAVLISVNEFTFTLETNASITLTPDLIVEFTDYDIAAVTDKQKLVWGWMTDDPTFTSDGTDPYTML